MRERRSPWSATTQIGEVLAASPVILYTLHITRDAVRPVWVSENVERLLGYTPAETLASGWWMAHVHPLDRDSTRLDIRELRRSGLQVRDFRFFHKSGQLRWIHDECRLSGTADAAVREATGAWRDVSDARLSEQLREARISMLDGVTGHHALSDILSDIALRLESLYSEMRVSILVRDARSGQLMTGAAPSLPEFFNQAVDGLEPRFGHGSCGTAAFTGETVIVEDIRTHPYWTPYVAIADRAGLRSCWSIPFKDDAGGVLGTFGIYYTQPRAPSADELEVMGEFARIAGLAVDRIRAHADLQRSRQALERLAHYDKLTDLPNRMLLQIRLEQALETATRLPGMVAILFIDVDRFKLVNDSLGHPAGDVVLQAVARRMGARLRPGDTLGRFGGDEFLVILEGVTRRDEAAGMASSIMDRLREPIDLGNGREVYVTVSIGISVFPDDARSGTELIQHADTAMYLAKESDRNNLKFYTAELTLAADARLALDARMRRGLQAGEFVLHFQPQISIVSGAVDGCEALVRWHDPVAGLVSPMAFIPLAEETGFILALGSWVLAEACRQVMSWPQDGTRVPTVSVNLSGRQLRDPDIVSEVAGILAVTGLPPGRLKLELTETTLAVGGHEGAARVSQLCALGVGLAIDDFGTGWCNLSHLQSFPIDELKIDQSFVRRIPRDSVIAETIIAMAHKLGFRVVAEGVEESEQLHFLSERGCGAYQGFLCSPALPSIEFCERFIAPSAAPAFRRS